MEYHGRYSIFDFSKVYTYPLAERKNKTHLSDLIDLQDLQRSPLRWDDPNLRMVAQVMVRCHREGREVIWFNGAHLIKNGLSPIVNDLIRRGLITHYATTGAGTIHDFELSLIGETSEHVPQGLPKGLFGMAHETGQYMNDAVIHGNRLKLGLGESLARMIQGEAFPYVVDLPHRDVSILAAAYEKGIPVTVHVTLGADILHQHPNFDGEAYGGTSGRDFGILAATVTRLAGGMFLNVGSAVTGPEVLLKAVSMAANVGSPPSGITTADFDLRPIVDQDIRDENKPTYYLRDIKSVVTRIPEAFEGRGYYIFGDQRRTLPALYQLVVQELEKG